MLSDFARTMVTDFPIQAILDHLVQRIVEVLPVTAAGVTLISATREPRYIAASDDSALRFEKLQSALGQGPCLWAYESGQAIAVPDIRADQRFPQFAEAAASSGLGAVFTYPLRHGEGCLGALDLYRDTPGALEPHDMDAAQTLADVAAAYLLNAQAREEARTTSDRLHHTVLHDALTGLPNRVLLQQRLEHAAQRAQRSHSYAAILFADLDRFKRVNDTFGHQVGDQLLRAVAVRLTNLVRPGDTLARVSGDEFVVLCEDLAGVADVELLAARILRSFDLPFVLDVAELAVTASIGMAFAGPGEELSDQLVVDADMAMYQAKRKGGAQQQIIDLRAATRADHRNGLERDLRTALEGHEIDVHYQPMVRSGDGLVVGVEALLRWTHPVRGVVPATSLVEVAELSGMISEIGAWVLERACGDHARLLAEHPGLAVDLAVNVSARQLMSPDFTGTVERVLARTGTDPTTLVLEVTESIFVEDVRSVTTVLSDLAMKGIRLALDDFGTGYSSLSYLRRLPVHIVKIDRSFVADTDRLGGGDVVRAIAELAHVFGLSVTAEGVETRDQAEAVRAAGCEEAQGFFYGRPVPITEVGPLLGRVRAEQTEATTG